MIDRQGCFRKYRNLRCITPAIARALSSLLHNIHAIEYTHRRRDAVRSERHVAEKKVGITVGAWVWSLRHDGWFATITRTFTCPALMAALHVVPCTFSPSTCTRACRHSE